MVARGFIGLSNVLVLVMYLGMQCKAENRWISRPYQTTAVKEGSNVTLAWRYILSNNITPNRITFGVWQLTHGYIDTKLLLVTQSGRTMVNSLVKGRMFFEGTLTNPGSVTITILNVSLQDSKTYGLEINTGLSHSSFKHSFTLLVYNRTSTYPPTTSSLPKGFFEKFMTHILILTVVTILVACGICLCVAVLRCRRKNNQGKTCCTKKRKIKRKQLSKGMVITTQRMYKEPSTHTLDRESDEVAEEEAPFTKFEVNCILHNTDVRPMKTFGHHSNSVKSSMKNHPEVPTDIEGGLHVYHEIDAAQGPALPPRNSIKRKHESSKSNEKNTRSSKKHAREHSSGGKRGSTREKVHNENRGEIANYKGGEETTHDRKGCQNKSSPIYYNKDCDSYRRTSSKHSKSTNFSTSCPSESEWEVAPEGVHLCNRIGAGSFGQVWKGLIEGKHVAVKMLNERASSSDEKDLISELEVMKTLKPHPNVVKLKGCITRATVRCGGSVFYPPLVFLELVPYGDLLGYLRKSRGEDDDYYSGKDLKCPKRPTPQHLFSFAHDVAKGMAFLAENKIVHRDLAARNILIGDRLRCKITDFGMARTLHNEDIYTKRSNGLFPVKWMAIESLLFQKYTTYSDVWSYGVVLYEIFTLGGRPYAGLNGLEVIEMIKNGKRLSKPQHIYSRLYSLMLKCWSKNPNHRPDFVSLCRQVTLLAKDHQRYLNLKEYDHRLYINVPTL